MLLSKKAIRQIEAADDEPTDSGRLKKIVDRVFKKKKEPKKVSPSTPAVRTPESPWPWAPNVPKLPAKQPSNFTLDYCPFCRKMVTLTGGESMKHHYKKVHPKEAGPKQVNPEFQSIEDFEFDPVGDGERTGKPCPKCGFEMSYYDDYDPKKGLWPYYQCEKCGHWEDEKDDDASTGLNAGSWEDMFKDCPKCGAEMLPFEAETNEYWVCDKCGYNEKINQPTNPTSGFDIAKKKMLAIDHNLWQYQNRKVIDADKITPQIYLGDVVNGWLMRDAGTGKPFDAILNVSQHTYTPPPDVEYIHLPIEEYSPSPKKMKERLEELTKAVGILKNWADAGKKVYVHCSEGMNRSPSVIIGYLFNKAKEAGMGKDPEDLYDTAVSFISAKRYVAQPYGVMEDTLREFLGLPPLWKEMKKWAPETKGGWFQKPKKVKYPTGTQVHYKGGRGVAGKEMNGGVGTVVSPPAAGGPDTYWVKDQNTGDIVVLNEKALSKKPFPTQVRYYPGERETMQTYPKFPPAGGIHKRKKKKKASLSKRAIDAPAGVDPSVYMAWEQAHQLEATFDADPSYSNLEKVAAAILRFMQNAAQFLSPFSKARIPRIEQYVISHPPSEGGDYYSRSEATSHLGTLDAYLNEAHSEVIGGTGTGRMEWYNIMRNKPARDPHKDTPVMYLSPEEQKELGIYQNVSPEQLQKQRGPGAPFLEEMWKRRKYRRILSKRMLPTTRRSGRNVFAAFTRRAISQSEMYNFYAVMQLPPAFFQAFPKWEAYAREIVDRVSAEYAKYLERLVRTEAVDTYGVMGGSSDDDDSHDHDWTDTGNDVYHTCDDCGENEEHEEWTDADFSGHTCDVCGHADSHNFDSDHECTVCHGSYDHNWRIDGDQHYECQFGEDADGDERDGCGAETEYLPGDDQLPAYGDFWEERHQHNFVSFPAEDDQDGYRCNICGRAFIDETGDEQLGLDVERKEVSDPSAEFMYHNTPKMRDLIKQEHDANPALHEWEFMHEDTDWHETNGGEWVNVDVYRCRGCEEYAKPLRGQTPAVGGQILSYNPSTHKPELSVSPEGKANINWSGRQPKNWKELVTRASLCPSCPGLPELGMFSDDGWKRCKHCGRVWDQHGHFAGVTVYTNKDDWEAYNRKKMTGCALSIRQITAAPRRRRRDTSVDDLMNLLNPGGPVKKPTKFTPSKHRRGPANKRPRQKEFWPKPKPIMEQQKQIHEQQAVQHDPAINIDTSKWFDFNVQLPEENTWVPWSTLRSSYPPKFWRMFERSIINNPQSVLTAVGPGTAPGTENQLAETTDQETLDKFQYLVQLKKMLLGADRKQLSEVLGRFEQYKGELRTDTDDIFLSIFNLKNLYSAQKPDQKDAIILNEIQPELKHAWDEFLAALREYDSEAADFYQRYDKAPQPEWAASAAAMSNQVPVAKGTGSSPGTASGMAAITAEMAMELAGQGNRVILVRPETTPEDIGAMKASAGFLTAHGGPTAHAAIVARQLGKPCIVGAGFTISENVITFPGGKTVEVGSYITIDGRTGSISVMEQGAEEPEEEKHVEPPKEGENWDDEFEKILALDNYMKSYEEQDYSHTDDLERMDLVDLAQAFNYNLKDGSYGGKLWGLAAIRAKQVQEAIRLNMPWRYKGMVVDQINTLQHNSGNIFYAKPWPGSPSDFINDVLDTKGSDHAMTWIEMVGHLTDETKAMLRDYRMWARREGYPSIYGTDVSGMTREQLQELMEKEKYEVRQRRKGEKGKWANHRVWVIKYGNVIKAMHRFAKASLTLHISKDGKLDMHKMTVADQWRGKGVGREMADAIERAYVQAE